MDLSDLSAKELEKACQIVLQKVYSLHGDVKKAKESPDKNWMQQLVKKNKDNMKIFNQMIQKLVDKA
jgi:hypothetical protein